MCQPGVFACNWRMAFCAGVSTFWQYAIQRPDASATCSTVDIDLHNAISISAPPIFEPSLYHSTVPECQ